MSWSVGTWNLGRFFGGIMDDMRWWSVARTQADIKTYMNKPLPAAPTGLTRQWTFDEGQGLGDATRSPQWVPSPVKGSGGPIALSTSTGAGPQSVKLCAVLWSSDAVSTVAATFTSTPALGSLSASTNIALSKTAWNAVQAAQEFCGTVNYTPTKAGMETLNFDVKATLGNAAVVSATQALAVSISQLHTHKGRHG